MAPETLAATESPADDKGDVGSDEPKTAEFPPIDPGDGEDATEADKPEPVSQHGALIHS